ncbi:hypothetical protein TSUD_119310 [Trifolium subterraneum]|uniref:Uncharacterized protein n=1 Tax=Trifolium subterraneum TaxID=3900 RepID=A0A2Z6N3I0_TRISU|nr:hypothetical protein TSUD_119310 [Trifolium subterraneum]
MARGRSSPLVSFDRAKVAATEIEHFDQAIAKQRSNYSCVHKCLDGNHRMHFANKCGNISLDPFEELWFY